MGRASTKPNKNQFQIAREALGLTREKASALLEIVTTDRLVRIESDKANPYPEEVLAMAKVYQMPDLCNYYCSHICPIGQVYVPEVKMKGLSHIVLEMLASLNRMTVKKERLIEIAADDGIISDEIEDFIEIQNELERISVTISTLQLWAEKMLSSGAIDPELYRKRKEQTES